MESEKLLRRSLRISENQVDNLIGHAVKVISIISLCALPLLSIADEHESYSFSIFEGGNAEVCPYYRDALNESAKHRIPYCDRRIDSPSPPFRALGRVYMDAREIVEIYEKVQSFRITSDQLYSERVSRPFLYPTHEESVKSIDSFLRTKQLSMWKFSPRIDIDNDGEADSVLAWRHGRCRGSGDSSPRYGTLLLVLSAEETEVDESKTEALFGDSKGCGPKYYCPRSSEMDVFVFENQTYFDAWFDDAVRENEGNRLRVVVYKHSDGRTTKVCELVQEPN